MAVPVFAAEGVAVIKGTSSDSLISGEVKFKETKKGLTVEAKLKNVPKTGKLGFHIHENGSCDDMGKAAGGHYNPMGTPHGLLAKDGEHKAHAGDLGNVEIAADETGVLKGFLPGVTLQGGKYNVAGKAVILHEKQDDFGQPTGNAGGRIGCGIIQVKSEVLQNVQAVEVGNKVCPVSGEKVGQMGDIVKYEYNGKIYNLCCPMCKKDFSKDPEKYRKIAEDEVKK